jgi:tRNA A-37 threonylcarbamoyl transferase component Bud32/dipeptidyl aminopeptidase/acylaminoacyl peptidase
VAEALSALTAALAGRYRVERELGQGGMATVYLAHDLRHDRDVAIKVLHPDLGAALGGERFLTEIRTTARLQHPHILPLLDSGTTGEAGDGLLYYVMPLVTGETLRARLERERQLPIADAVRLAREVASALDYAHRHGVIHRDIKPENILLHDGSALVADFGIALAVQQAGGQRLTQTGLSLGTPQYMSPEQAMGERTIDARSDIYALAAVTYEMLTGDPPFTGSSIQAVVAKVLSAEPERPTLVRKTIPAAIERAVLTGLAKLPADRFGTAAEFASALRDLGEGAAPTRSDVTSPVPVRGGRAVGLAAGIALGLVAGTGGVLLAKRSGGAPNASGELTRVQVTFTGIAGRPAITARGDVIAYVQRRCDQRGHEGFTHYEAMRSGDDPVPCRSSLIVQDTGATTPVTVIADAPWITTLRWTPSVTSLVIAAQLDSARQGTFVIPRLGGTARRLGPAALIDVHATADTVLLLPGTRERGTSAWASVVVLATGTVADSIRMPSPNIAGLAWSPDGQLIVVTDAGGTLTMLRRDGTVVDSTSVETRPDLRWTPSGDAIVAFLPAPARDDDFIRIAVGRGGRFAGGPVPLLPRGQALYRGEFDLARLTGLLAFISGDALSNTRVFDITPGTASTGREVTNGTSWYGNPIMTPDGRALFYMRGNAAGDNLYRLGLDDSAAAEEAISTGGGNSVGGLVEVSPDGRRLLFVRNERNAIRLREVDVAGRTTTVRDGFSTREWGLSPIPIGASGVVDVTADGRAVLVIDSTRAAVRLVAAPDSLRLLSVAASPDGRSVAMVVAAPNAAYIGTTPLTSWQFRALLREPGAPRIATVTWARDGYLYFARWDSTARLPVLARVKTEGGGPIAAPERVMTLPDGCVVEAVTIAAGARRGACQTRDFRGDVYLARIPGLAR